MMSQGRVLNFNDDKESYDLDTYEGSSGGPVFLLGHLRGIHVGKLGKNNGNFDVRLSTIVNRVFIEPRAFLLPQDNFVFTSIEIPDRITTIKNEKLQPQQMRDSIINDEDIQTTESIDDFDLVPVARPVIKKYKKKIKKTFGKNCLKFSIFILLILEVFFAYFFVVDEMLEERYC